MRQRHLLTSSALALILAFAILPSDAAAAGASNTNTSTGAVVGPVPAGMPAPTNLIFATDPASCEKFRAGLAPKAIDPCNDLANRPNSGTFHWDWQANGAHPAALGFKFYRTDGGHHDLLQGPTNKAVDGNAAIFFNSVVAGACYAVSAWNTTAESALSDPLCMANNLPQVALAVPVARMAPGAVAAPPVMRLPPPWRLLAFKEPKPCTAHGGSAGTLACEAALPKGGLALVWDYAPAHIDGFRAYSVPSPSSASAPASRQEAPSGAVAVRQAPIATQTTRLDNGSVATLVVLDPRPRGFGNECFAVAAFAGAQESEMSAPLCVAPGPVARAPR